MLGELALRAGDEPEARIEDEGARRGRALIDREKMACDGHARPPCLRLRPFAGPVGGGDWPMPARQGKG